MGNLTNWVLGTTELGKSCGANSSRNKIFRLHIPKILPLIPFGSPSSVSVALNRNCFCNAATCKPSISTTVATTNYMDVPATDNMSTPQMYYVKKTLVIEGLEEEEVNLLRFGSLDTRHGESVKVEALNGNVDNLQVISKM